MRARDRWVWGLALALGACGGEAAGPDTAEDVGADAVGDVGADVVEDVGVDATPDALEDTRPDANGDVGADAIDDVGVDAAPDALEDTRPDAVGDVGSDTIEDIGADTVQDTVVDVDTAEVGPSDDPWSGLSGEPLREALREATSLGHAPLGYNGGRDAMYARGGVDDHGGRIECIYTGRTVDTDGSRTPRKNCRMADGTPITCAFNTEHTWARYHLDLFLTEGSEAYYAAEGDIHHLHPSDEDVNNRRWHFDFGDTTCGETDSCKIDEGSELGTRPGLEGPSLCPTGNLDQDHLCVMRVRPERRGDIARGMLYMAVRYGMPMDDAMEAALHGWHLSDPPDERERTRNDGIEAAQGNRNPFVDWPGITSRLPNL